MCEADLGSAGSAARARGHGADSTLLYALISEFLRAGESSDASHAIERCLPFADPTRAMTVPGPLFSDICMRLYEVWGPNRLCRVVTHAWVEQWTPVSALFATARDAAQVVQRLQALERLFDRTSVSEIAVAGDNCVVVHRVLQQAIAQTASHSVCYWSYVISAFQAAGCEGIRLETPARVAIRGELVNVEALEDLRNAQCMRLSWERRTCKPRPSIPRLRAAGNARLVNDLTRVLEDSLARSSLLSLGQAARAVGQSTRTLQRRLREANVSLSQMRLALQLFIASRQLGQARCDLAQIAAEAGFSDASHLIHRFQQATAMTPREFQRRLLQ